MLAPSVMAFAFARFPSIRGPALTFLPTEAPKPGATHRLLVCGRYVTVTAAPTIPSTGTMTVRLTGTLGIHLLHQEVPLFAASAFNVFGPGDRFQGNGRQPTPITPIPVLLLGRRLAVGDLR